MGYETTVKALAAHAGIALLALDIETFGASLKGESDRGAIILTATALDDILANRLLKRMPNLNSSERKAIFDFNGPAGTFSARIKLAHALGIIDRQQRKKFDLLRSMRNACAHGRQILTFETPEIRDATLLLIDEEARDAAARLGPRSLREIFVFAATMILSGPTEFEIDRAKFQLSMIALVSGPDDQKRITSQAPSVPQDDGIPKQAT